MRVRHGLLIAGILALAFAATAFATYIPAVNYQPPKIVFVDQQEIGSSEDATITKDGHQYLFSNPFGVTKHPDSQPGCDKNTSDPYHCPVAGTRKIIAKLGAMNDQLSIDLGSKADKVTQVIKGEDGADTLIGGPGPQTIDGGPGTDDCSGGPGRDVIRNCEE